MIFNLEIKRRSLVCLFWIESDVYKVCFNSLIWYMVGYIRWVKDKKYVIRFEVKYLN